MDTPTLILQVFLLLKTLLYVDSQFMPGMSPMMGGMSFPQMSMSPMLRSPMSMAMPGMMPGMSMPMPMVPLMPDNKQNKSGKRKSKNKSKRKNKRSSKSHYETQESYSDESGGSSTEDASTRSYRESRRSYRDSGIQNRRQVLTPVIFYVTKDGYVIYQKKINQEKAKDWLSIGKGSQKDNAERMTSSEEILGDVLMKKLKKIRNRHK